MQKLNDLLPKAEGYAIRAAPHTHEFLECRSIQAFARKAAAAKGAFVENCQQAGICRGQAEPCQFANGAAGNHGQGAPRRLRKIA
jgi:hypothetical protein